MKPIENLKWEKSYNSQVARNIGFITYEEQENLRKTYIAVLGTGGHGGPLAEHLARIGCESLLICDNHKFKHSDLNRELCTLKDIGRFKVDILGNRLKNINQNINVKKAYEITQNNIKSLLKNVKIVALTLNDPVTSILIARYCRENDIPMIEAWGVPYLYSLWFTKNSKDFESCYGLYTNHLTMEQIQNSKEVQMHIFDAFIPKILKFPGLEETVNREKGVINAMVDGKLSLRSFAPMARISASYLAFEIVYAGILKVKPMNLAPKVVGYDYLRMKPIEFEL
ncbi:MAG: ThiF family adenylyltransferase [Candidatus Lokiarchaeota archaeon]